MACCQQECRGQHASVIGGCHREDGPDLMVVSGVPRSTRPMSPPETVSDEPRRVNQQSHDSPYIGGEFRRLARARPVP
jgi:hypothetical protein